MAGAGDSEASVVSTLVPVSELFLDSIKDSINNDKLYKSRRPPEMFNV